MPSSDYRTKSITRTKRGSGCYIEAAGTGNSAHLARCAFNAVDGLYEVARSERITYQCGSKFNECFHTVTSTDNDYLPAHATEIGSPAWRMTTNRSTSEATLEPFESERLALCRYLDTRQIAVGISEVENARIDGYNRLIHLNPPRHMNATQALMELKDTKDTLGPLAKFVKWGHRMLGQKVRVAKGILRPFSAAMRIADAASAYLWYTFGVEPTVQDVRAFVNDLSHGRFAIKSSKPQLLERGTVVRGIYAARPRPADILSLMYPSAPSGSFHIERDRRFLDTAYPSVICSGMLSIRADGTPDVFACRKVVVTNEVRGMYFAQLRHDLEIPALDSFRNRWAWNCPTFRTLWELLPFSFLVDWVVDVGKAIERLEKRYISVNYASHFGPVWRWERVSTVTYSPKLVSLQMSLKNPMRVGPREWTVKQTSTGSFGMYISGRSSNFTRRVTGVPTIVTPEFRQTIKAYQITTGMALLMQLAKSLIR